MLKTFLIILSSVTSIRLPPGDEETSFCQQEDPRHSRVLQRGQKPAGRRTGISSGRRSRCPRRARRQQRPIPIQLRRPCPGHAPSAEQAGFWPHPRLRLQEEAKETCRQLRGSQSVRVALGPPATLDSATVVFLLPIGFRRGAARRRPPFEVAYVSLSPGRF